MTHTFLSPTLAFSLSSVPSTPVMPAPGYLVSGSKCNCSLVFFYQLVTTALFSCCSGHKSRHEPQFLSFQHQPYLIYHQVLSPLPPNTSRIHTLLTISTIHPG